MKPRTLDRLTAASLLLFLAIAVLWALSFAVPAGADLRRSRWRVGFRLRSGEPSLRYQSAVLAEDLDHFHLNVAQPRWKRCGAELRTGRRTGVFWCDLL